MKPDTSKAMKDLIKQVRNAVPFDTQQEQLCNGPCTGCPKKLMEYLDTQLEEWEADLKVGEEPTFGDIQKLAKTSRKIYGVLEKNNLIKDQG